MGADLALLEVAHEDAVRPPRQQPGQIVLAQVQRQFAQVIALQRQDIESVELDLVIMPAGVQAVKIGYPKGNRTTGTLCIRMLTYCRSGDRPPSKI